MRRAATGVAVLLAVLLGAPAAGAQQAGSAGSATTTTATVPASGAPAVATPSQKPDELVPPGVLDRKPAGHRLDGYGAIDLAKAVPKVRAELRGRRDAYPGVYLKGPTRWQVGYYLPSRGGDPPKEIAQVTIDDRSARVVEAWTGDQVAWTMARGYPGAFGRKVNSPWVWIPLTVLFVVPFLQPRRWRRMVHLDLLVLVAFGVSVAYFNDAQIDVSVPLVYPLLVYLLLRMLWIGLRPARAADPQDADPARRRDVPLLVPATSLAVATIFLVGFRIGLNVTSSNVIDVGYAGVIGAQKLVDGDPLYGTFPKDNEHGDTYGPVVYAAYVPFEQVLPWSGRWDDLPAAHAASIAFDLAALVLLFLLGRRVRGPGLGIALAYGWAAYPFTLYAMNSGSNDSLVTALLLAALLAAGPARRGAAAALGGLSKFATLALVPLFALHERRPRPVVRFGLAFGACALLAMAPILLGGESLRTMVDRTLGFQADRESPFSIWGMYELGGLQRAWQLVAVGLALLLPLVRRRGDTVGLAACAAAIVLALQLGVTHWFYLYLVWVAPLVLLAGLGRELVPAAAPEPATAATAAPLRDADPGAVDPRPATGGAPSVAPA
ncbi:glycosyltransferase 87 family protein [Paraconexibacter algicola]|uniref:glycosyltransferase 87 family protein n=1 Tax=Paraconexibacter algicola TaxID=2133960 RepID=UPI0013050102|nr:glycosyltransferase 87 family protein [Paraconexibacter algicola]